MGDEHRSPPPPTVHALLRSFAYAPTGADSYRGETIDVAEDFHELAKIPADFPGRSLGPGGRWLASTPGSHLELGRKALVSSGPAHRLPAPLPLENDLAETIRRRRSGLPTDSRPMTQAELATVLALSAGRSTDPTRRVVPSGGGMYPLDVIAVVRAVDPLAPGAYVYDPITHALRPRTDVDPDEFHARVHRTAPEPPPSPAVTLAVVATFARSRVKYGVRGYRFTLMEAGHLAQNALLVATALGLATVPWGGFVDAEADHLLELDGVDRSCLYLIGLTRPGTSAGSAP